MAISPLKFYNLLKSHNIDFFTGVPDSLLKQLCLCIDDNVAPECHIIAANEGNSVALAAGYHLATGKLPLVYMQNSGLGNAINPLLSLCDPEVYSIPMLLLIGWRGEPDVHDEPQHIKQGKVQMDLLHAMGIPFEIISDNERDLEEKINNGVGKANKENTPFAIIIKKGVFDNYKSSSKKIEEELMTREEALEITLNKLPKNSIIVSTTGKTSREIFEIREKNNELHSQDFLTVGSMGHCSSIAMGIAIAKPNRKVFCIDGDGALIMHMGSLSTVGKFEPKNFYHILINNCVHESVGGQETSAKYIDIPTMVKSNGYKQVYTASDSAQLTKSLKELNNTEGPVFVEIKTKPGSRDNLGRPTIKPIDNKKDFMKFIQKNNF
jgi:phosphonopyruvate decarboxylase